MSDFHTRFTQFLKYLDRKPTSFELEMGFSNGSISKALNSKRSISSERLEKIFYKYDWLNPKWLFDGTPPMVFENRGKASVELSELQTSDFAKNKAIIEKIDELTAKAPDESYNELHEIKDQVKNLIKDNMELKEKLLKVYESRDKIISIIEKKL